MRGANLSWIIFVGLAAAIVLSPRTVLAAEPELDRFGGWRGLKFEATGFFRIDQRDGKHWFVTPEGHAFLANQMDHVAPRYLTGSYNKEFWAQKFNLAADAPPKAFIPGFWEKVKQDKEVIGFNSI